jgi:hypothetical protein
MMLRLVWSRRDRAPTVAAWERPIVLPGYGSG